MGYALLANLSPVHGLYMSFFPILIYFLLGTSKHLAIGAIAVVSLFSGNIIESLGDDYKHSLVNVTTNQSDALVMKYKIEVACALASFVGVLQLLMVF
jgi:MFS superfamily sulfate permease-like transporter